MTVIYARINSNSLGFTDEETELQRAHRMEICSKLSLDVPADSWLSFFLKPRLFTYRLLGLWEGMFDLRGIETA